MLNRIGTCPSCGSTGMLELALVDGSDDEVGMVFQAKCLDCHELVERTVSYECLHSLFVLHFRGGAAEPIDDYRPGRWQFKASRILSAKALGFRTAAVAYAISPLVSHEGNPSSVYQGISTSEWCEILEKFAKLPVFCSLCEALLETLGDPLEVFRAHPALVKGTCHVAFLNSKKHMQSLVNWLGRDGSL